jgi:A/G-specific adenine glycosylase
MMLQQTQVDRVLKKYARFLDRFPSFLSLKNASVSEVLAAWSGLGYNRRALYLKRTASKIIEEYGGILPSERHILETLPGIGRGTSGALSAFVFNAPVVFIETNIRRVFIHYFFGGTKRKIADAEILDLVEKTLDKKNSREWYYALMDYGSWLGKNNRENPNRKSALYKKQSVFRGSERELRGRILKYVIAHRGRMNIPACARCIHFDESSVRRVYAVMKREGFFGHYTEKSG